MDCCKRFRSYAPAGPPGVPPPGHTWAGIMNIALEEASKAGEWGDVPVGAVLVSRQGQIGAVAANQVELDRDPTAHAEILALRRAAAVLGMPLPAGCVLVATLEPCLMCTGAIINARVSGLVFGASDVLAGAIFSAMDYPQLPGARRDFWHLGGILGDASAQLLKDFFRQKRGQSVT